MKKLALLALAVVPLAGCTIVGGPGFTPETGFYAWVVDLDGDGISDGIISGCVTSAENPKPCSSSGVKAHQWLPFDR